MQRKQFLPPLQSLPSTARPVAFEDILRDGSPEQIDPSAISMAQMPTLIITGSVEQQMIIIFETQQLLKLCREFAINTLIPLICKQVITWDHSLQTSAAEAVSLAVNSSIPSTLMYTIFETAFYILRTSTHQLVCDLWGQILVLTLPNVSLSPHQMDNMIDTLENQNDSSKFSFSPKLTARILGSLAVCSDCDQLKLRIMRRAIDISDDPDPQVRGMIAESIAFIAAAVSISVVQNDIWPCLLKLSADENQLVHAASVRTVSAIATAHMPKQPKAPFFLDLLPQFFLQECTRIQKDASSDQRQMEDDTYICLEVNARIFGELLHSCSEHVQQEASHKAIRKAFMEMSTCNGPAIRKFCAFNMPGVSSCLGKSAAGELTALVEFLSRDSDPETRWVLAAGIHETVRILADKHTIDILLQAVIALLQDENALVRMNTIANFDALVRQFVQHHGYSSIYKLTPIFQNLHVLSEGDWRAQELLGKQLQLAAPVIPPPAIRSSVLPLLYQMSEGGTSLVRKATMAAIATCMRYLPDISSRETTMEMFRVEWAGGPVYWMRIAFIDSALVAVTLYSRCLFRDMYASELLRLAHDSVPNIRLRIALLLAEVAPACYQMEEFHTALDILKTDEDKDVQDAMEGVDERIAKSLETARARYEEDMKLEDEEQELLSRYYKAQKEAVKKGAVKHRTSVLLGKAAKGMNSSRMMISQSTSNMIENAGDKSNTNNNLSAQGKMPRRSLSQIIGGEKTSKSPFDSKQRKLGRSSSLMGMPSMSSDSPTGASSVLPPSRPFKGLRSLRPPVPMYFASGKSSGGAQK